MAIDRRSFLTGLGALTAAGQATAQEPRRETRYVAAYRAADGSHGAALIDAEGSPLRTLALPGRGHDATLSAVTGLCVMFARRPGNFAVAFQTRHGADAMVFTAPRGRHFYGHGVFSADGRLLYTTENAFADVEHASTQGNGRIGVYDVAAGFRRIGEFPSFGIGPHDIALMPDAPVLVVANGGTREHPHVGDGRRVLNPGAIVPSIAYVDVRTGDLLERHEPAQPSGLLSLRHLGVAPDGTVIIGCQAEVAAEPEPLIFRHKRQDILKPVETDQDAGALFRGYISSVGVDRSGQCAALTSSRSGIATVIDIATGRVLRRLSMMDVSGVAPAQGPMSFAFSAGTGHMMVESAPANHMAKARFGFDNHLATFEWTDDPLDA